MFYGDFWNRHIIRESLQEVQDWYGFPTYPPRLEYELRTIPRYWHDAAQPMSQRAFDRVLQQVKEYARASVVRFNLAYHNEVHFAEMAHAAVLLFDTIHGPAARTSALLPVRQAIEIAAWLHDCHHTGCTLRHDSVNPLHLPELGTDVSAEFVSAIAANDFLTWLQLPIQWRVFIVNCILATTFGGQAAIERGIANVPAISAVKTPYFALMRVADVWPRQDLWRELQGAVDVNFHEIPAAGQITDPITLLRAQVGFQDYRITEMQNLDRLVGKPVTARQQQDCTWRAALFQEAADGRQPDVLNYVTQCMR